MGKGTRNLRRRSLPDRGDGSTVYQGFAGQSSEVPENSSHIQALYRTQRTGTPAALIRRGRQRAGSARDLPGGIQGLCC